MKVKLVFDDIDRHGEGCECGFCNFIGKSYGVAIRSTEFIPGVGDPLTRVYGPSEEAAFDNAKLFCKNQDWQIEEDEEDA